MSIKNVGKRIRAFWLTDIRCRLIFLLGLFFLTTNAFADTEVCVAPSKVYKVQAKIHVSPESAGKFVEKLHRFADDKGYFFLIDPTVLEKIDGFLVKKGTDEGIHIRAAKKDTIIAEMTECGSKKFEPYWKEFLLFKKRLECHCER